MHRFRPASPKPALWLAATLMAIVLPLAVPAASSAEETTLANANNYECQGFIQAGQPEEGNEEQQVEYQFYCNGRITGYQIQSALPLSGFSSSPILTYGNGQPTTDQFSCSGEFPGYAVNCVGSSAGPNEIVKGQFSIGSKLCQGPREDPLLTVTYAYLEKEVVTQAISGPFDLGTSPRLPAQQSEHQRPARTRTRPGSSKGGQGEGQEGQAEEGEEAQEGRQALQEGQGQGQEEPLAAGLAAPAGHSREAGCPGRASSPGRAAPARTAPASP